MAIGERRRGPISPGRVGVQVAADEPELFDAALELRSALDWDNSRRLRQLTDTDEILRVQRADAVNQVVAGPSPASTRRLVADVMGHGRGAWRKNGQIRTPRPLQLELGVLQALANLVVADRRLRVQGEVQALFQTRDLRVAKFLQRARRRGVVTVTIDDHGGPRAPNVQSRQYMRFG